MIFQRLKELEQKIGKSLIDEGEQIEIERLWNVDKASPKYWALEGGNQQALPMIA